MNHESRLTTALRALLRTTRTASLGTIDTHGNAFVSMVPFAIDPQTGLFIVHVSQLAAHTGYLLQHPQVALLITQPEQAEHPVHDLPRVTVQGRAAFLERDSAAWQSGRQTYLARFPDAEPMTQLGDFCFVGVTVEHARQVAGFGAARTVDVEEILQVLRTM